MLNDLRSSPGSRLLPPPNHLHQRTASNPSTASSPLTVGGPDGGNAGSGGGGGGVASTGQTTTGYLHSAFRGSHSNQFGQQQATNAQRQTHVQPEKRQQQLQQQLEQQSKQAAKVQIIPAAATTTITTTTAATSSIPQRYNRYQYNYQQQQYKPTQTHRCCASAANACNQAKNHNATTTKTAIGVTKLTAATSKAAKTQTATTTTITNSTTRYQQRHNPHAVNRLHASTTATVSAAATSVALQTTTSSGDGSYSGCELVVTAGNVAPLADDVAAVATHCSGLSAEVRRIEKLPLWSYQHKQLQQPQKLQVQLLQQQRATKAIAVMHAAAAKTTATTSLAGSKRDTVSRGIHLSGCGSSSVSAISSGGPYGASARVYAASVATTTSVTTLTTAQVMDYTRVDGCGISGGGSDAFRLNWLQPATIYFG